MGPDPRFARSLAGRPSAEGGVSRVARRLSMKRWQAIVGIARVVGVTTKQRVTAAYERLIDRFGTQAEKTALDRRAPLERPAEADLINRAINNARDPSAGTTELRAALELAGLDQRTAETREINRGARPAGRGGSCGEIAPAPGLQ